MLGGVVDLLLQALLTFSHKSSCIGMQGHEPSSILGGCCIITGQPFALWIIDFWPQGLSTSCPSAPTLG